MITTVSPTEEQTALAKKKAKDMGSIKNSITKGEGNVSGFISGITTSVVLPKRLCIKNVTCTFLQGTTNETTCCICWVVFIRTTSLRRLSF